MLENNSNKKWDFWIDRGGTFTDIVARDPSGKIFTDKLLSVNARLYADAGMEGIKRFLKIPHAGKIPVDSINSIKMGTTVATNALLERKGVPVVLLTTKGLKDQLRIAYQNRPNLFDRKIILSDPLYDHIIEVEERVTSTGEILRPLNKQKLFDDLRKLENINEKSCAIVFMHSCKFSKHEREAEEVAKYLGFSHVSVSYKTSQIMKYVMRGDTTVADAYLSPVLNKYIENLYSEFDGDISSKISFMQSNGGLTNAALFSGKDSILSGPAGGVIGGIKTSALDNQHKIIGFDMGGTSTDVWHYSGELERTVINKIDGIRISIPMLSINTIAAGGGSILTEKSGRLIVGPKSAGATPGPACYDREGPLTITDSNLVTGRIQADFFPKTFGDNSKKSLSLSASQNLFKKLSEKLNVPMEEIAEGYISVADNSMAEAIKKISVQRGHDLREYCLAVFGGAAGQHACSIAEILDMKTCLIHPHASVLSAYGMGLAEIRTNRSMIIEKNLNREALLESAFIADSLITSTTEILEKQNVCEKNITNVIKIFIKLDGTDTSLDLAFDEITSLQSKFTETYLRLFGFKPVSKKLVIESVFVEAIGSTDVNMKNNKISKEFKTLKPVIANKKVFIDGEWNDCKFFPIENLNRNSIVNGPAVLVGSQTSILLKRGWEGTLLESGTIKLKRVNTFLPQKHTESAQIEVFNNLFMSIAEQMGFVLEKTSQSITIKERLDFSCAIFDRDGELVANAPHMPVHLGSMDSTVKSIIKNNSTLSPGDLFAINAPYNGGTHLPDITIVNPIWNSQKSEIIFYTAARGHHTDIGGLTPGSMPCNSTDIHEEGIYIDNWKIVENGVFKEDQIKNKLLSGSYPARSPLTNIADLKAQIAACKKGEAELLKIVDKYGLETVFRFQELVCQNAENAVRESIKTIKTTEVAYQMDDDLSGAARKISIKLTPNKKDSSIEVDFHGTTMQLDSNYNAPLPVTRAAVLYAFRILTGGNIPMNSGIMKPIKIKIPRASMLSPEYPAAVIAGNVETSQAVTSALLMSFGIQAASQSTMNNITWGNEKFQYYETICGGTGAGIDFSGNFYEGTSAVHSHMTNSRLTDPETLEFRFPVILEEFSIRSGSGGIGQYQGGDGVIRKISLLKPMIISVLSGHRTIGPPGILGGGSGKVGSTSLLRNNGSIEILKYADQVEGQKGDILVVKTPGGGGLGALRR
ncbi:hydantoinase B/oxoprolinase family protein [Paracoccaceae bacterium]|nr:hydantoinase B/oxoprolinase family protein [Paracoccaceae bacterium]